MKFTYIGNQENKEIRVTGSYANGAYVTANAAYDAQNTTATYANAAFVYANAAFIAANTGGSATDQVARDTANGSFVQANAAFVYANAAFIAANTSGSATDQYARDTANGSFVQANAAYGQANTATNNASAADSKAVDAGTYANAAYTQANTATTNAATADSKAVTAGTYANSAYTQANTATTNAAGASIYANAAFAKANSGVANTATTANVAINARITIVNTGIYYPIVTDTTITGSDTFHYSSNDFSMYASNNTFRATGNVWAGENIVVGANIPVVNATGYWTGQALSATDSTARTIANSAFITANNALPKAGGVVTGNITFNQGATDIGANNILAQNITATGNLIISGTGGDISNANTVFANVVSLTTAAIVAGLNVVPYLQSSFAQANTAATDASNAFIQANAAFAAANAGGAGTDSFARSTANASFIQANAAFAAANAGGAGTDQYARNTANAALAAANSAGNGLLIYNNLFTANGNTSTFSLSTSPETEDFTFVNIDGVLQLKSTYSISGNTVVLTENVPANSNVEITVLSGTSLDQYSRNVANAAFAQANTGGGGGGTTTSNNGSTLSGSITPLANTSDQFNIIGITGNITIETPAGTPTDGQKLIIRIKDAGTSVNVSWNVIYRAVGVSLPTTTIANKTAYIGFIYNTLDADWDAIALSLEA